MLEFLGCLIAVVGGLWLGAVYLGIDIQGLAYTALDDVEVLDSLPQGCRPKPPPGHPAELTEEELAARLKNEMIALRKEISALRATTSRQQSQPVRPVSVSSDPKQPTTEQTLAYWKHLRDIALDEAALQADAQAALTEANADRVFSLRGNVSRFATKAVEAAPDQGVDPQALELGKQLAQWYHRGAELYGEAAELWSNPNQRQSSAQLAHQWTTSERQLDNEADLLANKAAAVCAALTRRYHEPFPDFGE